MASFVGRVIITPDEAVAAAIAALFARFAEHGSAGQVLGSLRDDGLRLPRRPRGGAAGAWPSGA